MYSLIYKNKSHYFHSIHLVSKIVWLREYCHRIWYIFMNIFFTSWNYAKVIKIFLQIKRSSCLHLFRVSCCSGRFCVIHCPFDFPNNFLVVLLTSSSHKEIIVWIYFHHQLLQKIMWIQIFLEFLTVHDLLKSFFILPSLARRKVTWMHEITLARILYARSWY